MLRVIDCMLLLCHVRVLEWIPTFFSCLNVKISLARNSGGISSLSDIGSRFYQSDYWSVRCVACFFHSKWSMLCRLVFPCYVGLHLPTCVILHGYKSLYNSSRPKANFGTYFLSIAIFSSFKSSLKRYFTLFSGYRMGIIDMRSCVFTKYTTYLDLLHSNSLRQPTSWY